MSLPTISTPLLGTDPGVLFWAPLGSTEPTNTVTGSVFTDSWPVAWLLLGATDAGHTFNYQLSTDAIEVAEFLDPVKYVETGRVASIAFTLTDIHAGNLKKAINGGTLTTTGSGATTKSELTPPGIGQSVRAMIGWESQDSTERLVCYQTINTGQLSISRGKGTNKAMISCEFALEIPSSGVPFKHISAGATRGA